MRLIFFLRKYAAPLPLILALGGCGFFRAPAKPQLPRDGQACSIVRSAYSQLGNSYTPGGASPQRGFDCSGLVWWAYKQHGYNIPRITTDQARTGRAVPKKKIKAGDILVFKTGRSPRGLHTGLYAGADSFIHSPRRGQTIRLESMNSTYWHNNLISVRRVLR